MPKFTVGFNFVPSTAVNTTEIWQRETFDLPTIQRELGWAAAVGFNSFRIFIQYLVWKHDPDGLKERLNQLLEVGARLGMSVMPVLFDDCEFSKKPPFLGQQDPPVPGKMMTSWTASPGHAAVVDRDERPSLRRYVVDMVSSFARDERIVAWDLYNEPGNEGIGERSLPLLAASFDWAFEVAPLQPITAGVWNFGDDFAKLNALSLSRSTLISFHTYGDLPIAESTIDRLPHDGRPIVCTEYMARWMNSRFETHLPMFKRRNVGSYSWGLVNGRTNTQFGWPFLPAEKRSDEWFHDIFHPNGRPFSQTEIDVIREASR